MSAVTLIGTGSPLPDPHRAGPCTLINSDATRLLFDCGRAALMRLAAVGIGAVNLDAVCLTHLHSDHLTDLGDVITTRWITAFAPTPLRIFGPLGTRAVVDAVLASLAPDISYRLAHHADIVDGPLVEVVELVPGDEVDVGEFRLEVDETHHRPVHPTIGYRVTGPDGVVAIAGDTKPCEGLDRLCADAAVYVQTVVRDDLISQLPVARLTDILDYHSSVAEAAQTAQRNRVRTLVLTHYVPAPPPGDVEAWIAQAKEHFDGHVVAGDDLTRVEVAG